MEFEQITATSINNNNVKNTTTQFFKVYIRICQFSKSSDQYPGSTIIRSKNSKDLAFYFKFNEETISICLNSMKDEMVIPLNQLYLRREESKVTFKKNKDPTGGLLAGTHSILLTPYNECCPEVLFIIEAGINKLWFDRFGIVNELKLSANSPSLSISCYLPHQTRALLLFPKNENFFHFVVYIKGRFKYPLKRLKYKTRKGDIVSLNDEKDWELAKGSAITKNNIEIYIE
ncbi:11166_t:CDS:2 [Diversispora eburnea]|uniref:11166_t:CDS:1 n=1 Tax=Diversispora eburnea TaxID=1213867 RepID=A0A9N8VYI9_9GLOM|nr:11166_t:CDS:2 [Diversispora eburnea]